MNIKEFEGFARYETKQKRKICSDFCKIMHTKNENFREILIFPKTSSKSLQNCIFTFPQLSVVFAVGLFEVFFQKSTFWLAFRLQNPQIP